MKKNTEQFDAAEYRALREKCERFNVWERVHEFILRHLSTGCDLVAEDGWPLPKTGTSTADDRIEGYPRLTQLIQIALGDGRPKDALTWYGQSMSGCGGIREYELDRLGNLGARRERKVLRAQGEEVRLESVRNPSSSRMASRPRSRVRR